MQDSGFTRGVQHLGGRSGGFASVMLYFLKIKIKSFETNMAKYRDVKTWKVYRYR